MEPKFKKGDIKVFGIGDIVEVSGYRGYWPVVGFPGMGNGCYVDLPGQLHCRPDELTLVCRAENREDRE